MMCKQRKGCVFIIDDHPVVRQGLAQLIHNEPDLCVCGEAGDAEAAIKTLKETETDIVIADISLPGQSGIDFIRDLKKMSIRVPVLVLSIYDESVYAERVLDAGARGYIMKQEAADVIIQAIRQIIAGDVYLSPSMTQQLLNKIVSNEGMKESVPVPAVCLTDRELEVFHLIGKGYTSKEIALRLNLSIKTIETYREHIKRKLHLKNYAELIKSAAQWVLTETSNDNKT